MTYKEALEKKTVGDWKTVGRLCGITPENAAITSKRPNAKKYNMVMDALVKAVEARENLVSIK